MKGENEEKAEGGKGKMKEVNLLQKHLTSDWSWVRIGPGC